MSDGPQPLGPGGGTPRWVIAFGVVTLLLLVLMVILHLAMGGIPRHGG